MAQTSFDTIGPIGGAIASDGDSSLGEPTITLPAGPPITSMADPSGPGLVQPVSNGGGGERT